MEQAETIWEGVHIADRVDMEHDIRLYKIDNLYVEALYRKEYKVLRRFEAFTKLELLENIYTYRENI